ncbi:hypothetical protein FD755_006021, partial [Muntiacus reevesi]
EATEQEIRSLFEQCWKVLECDSIKNYGFAHAEYKTAAEDAIHNRKVKTSQDKSKASTKLHVGNITKFEEYGPGIKYDDIVRDYAFVHMEWAEDANSCAIVHQLLWTAPGMGDWSGCCQCGKEGHRSKECPTGRTGRCAQLTPWAVGNPFITTMLSSRAPDYCKLAAAASPHDYTEQTMSHLPQVQNIAVTRRLSSTSVDPDRQTPEPPASCSRAVRPTGGEGHGYGLESELSQASAEACNSLWHGPVRTNGSHMWAELGTQPLKNWR